MADYNRRFAKPPRHDFDVHSPLENNENLEEPFTWRVQRKDSKNLTLQYDKTLYLLEDNEENRRFRKNTLMSGSIRTALSSSGLTVLPCPLSPTTGWENWTRGPSSTINAWD